MHQECPVSMLNLCPDAVCFPAAPFECQLKRSSLAAFQALSVCFGQEFRYRKFDERRGITSTNQGQALAHDVFEMQSAGGVQGQHGGESDRSIRELHDIFLICIETLIKSVSNLIFTSIFFLLICCKSSKRQKSWLLQLMVKITEPGGVSE